MRCNQVSEALPAYPKGDVPLGLRRHLARCAECRTELARYRTIDDSLTRLSSVPVEPPPDLRGALLAIPGRPSPLSGVRSHVSRNRKTYAGVAVAALGAAGAAVWRSRRGRLATA